MSASGPVLPTFILIGASKAGTTSLARYLGAHPDVFVCSPKEPEFFVAKRRWGFGVDWYSSLFARGASAAARGEASTLYTFFPHHPGVPARMRKVVPDVRLVYLIRNPIERMVSLYRHLVDLRLEPHAIDEALLGNPEYLDSSRYAMQLEQYLAHFDRSQLLVLTSDDLARHRAETLRATFSFIDVDPAVIPEAASREFNRAEDHRRPVALVRRLRSTRLYVAARRALPTGSLGGRVARRALSRPSAARAGAASPSEETRSRLLDALRPDLERLCAIVGPGFDAWGLLDQR